MNSSQADHIQNETNRLKFLVRIGLGIGVCYLVFATLQPFWSALVWAAVLSHGLYPVYTYLLRVTKGRSNLSALIVCVFLTVGLILPILAMSLLLGEELIKSYKAVADLVGQGKGAFQNGLQDYPFVSTVVTLLEKYEKFTGADLQSALANNVAQAGSFAVQKLSSMAGNVLLGLFQLGIILLSSFFLFRDGKVLITWVKTILPIPLEHQKIIFQRFDEVVSGTIYGNSLIAVMEGIVGGLAFWLVGLPSPVLWGSLMAVLAFLPLVGAAFVWVPGALYLFYQGAYLQVLGLIIAGVIIFLLDYIVRTVLIGGKSKLHTLLVFLGVLGGLQFFGMVGLVVGPLVVAISIVFLETFRREQPTV
jgi:predicted PurR-regulated permease PerM